LLIEDMETRVAFLQCEIDRQRQLRTRVEAELIEARDQRLKAANELAYYLEKQELMGGERQ